MITARVDFSRFEKRIERYSRVVRRPLDDILRQGARLAALSLIRSTFPRGEGDTGSSGLNKASQKQGQEAVARSILSIYGTTYALGQDIRAKEPRLYGAFVGAVLRGDYRSAESIVRRALGFTAQIDRFDGGAAHHRHRKFTGESRRRKILYIVDHPKLFAYIKQVQKRVGFAKGGWYQAGAAIAARGVDGQNIGGGLARVANWIASQPASGTHTERGTGRGMTITLANQVRYIGKILSGKYRQHAVDLAHNRMFKMMGSALRHELRKTFPATVLS